jgi:PAS domain S-box-containing protein
LDYTQEHLWGHAFNHLGVAVAQLTLGGSLLTANDQLCEVIDRPRKDLLEKNFREIFQPEGSWSACERGLTQLVAGEVHRYSIDLSAKRRDGQVVWVKVFFSLALQDVTGAPRGLIAVATDITPLKQQLQDAVSARDELSHRMTNAQEADRTRIARELHDDIGQSLAVLKIRMLRAGQPVSGRPDQKHANLKDLVGDLEMITQKVGRLSYDLHSSELEFLGLAVAVQAQCRQCSAQLHIPVDCSCHQVQPRLDGRVALAFLRVVQEALHNIVKHSHAKNITVRLTGSDSDLALEVDDDGVGFDVESSKLAAGLGLISMRERIYLINGEFEIRSRPGQGTKITARAPIKKETM